MITMTSKTFYKSENKALKELEEEISNLHLDFSDFKISDKLRFLQAENYSIPKTIHAMQKYQHWASENLPPVMHEHTETLI